MAAAVADFRSALQDRLLQKQNQLGKTESTLKKFVGESVINNRPRPTNRAPLGNRLGPPPSSAQPIQPQKRLCLGARLGPKLTNDNNDGFIDNETQKNVSVLSRVVVEQKSREKALEAKKKDHSDMIRSRRMFGNLMGTLQKFRQDESRIKERELKKKLVEKKIEEKTEKEKQEAKKAKQELFSERQRQKHEIKILQLQMRRVEEYEVWESAKRRQMQFIRTKKGPRQIFYLPKVHNDQSLTALEETMDSIEEEIKVMKARFEEDLLKIEAKINNPHLDPDNDDEDDGDEDENEENDEKPKSVVSKVQRAPSPPTLKSKPPPQPTTKKEKANGQVEEKKIIKVVENVDYDDYDEKKNIKIKIEEPQRKKPQKVEIKKGEEKKTSSREASKRRVSSSPSSSSSSLSEDEELSKSKKKATNGGSNERKKSRTDSSSDSD